MPRYSERIGFTKPALSEALKDRSLPSIDMLKIYFHDSLQYVPKDARANYAVDLAERLMAEHPTDSGNGNSYIYPSEDVVSALFLDAIRHQGQLGPIENNGRLLQRDPDKFVRFMDTRSHFQIDLTEYDNTFGASLDTTKYEAIEVIMYEADCAVKNKEDLVGDERLGIRRNLTGLLAEHKVLDCLRSADWPLTHYSSYAQDNHFKADIIVPYGELRDRTDLELQIKSSTRPDAALTVELIPHSNVIKIVVPMHRSLNQFRFTEDEEELLVSSLNEIIQNRTPERV